MRSLPVVAALALSACGVQEPYSYRVDCFQFDSEIELNAQALKYDVQLAEEAFKPYTKDVCKDLLFIHAKVRDVDYWTAQKVFLVGSYSQVDNPPMTLSKNVSALVHEMFHAWDLKHWVFDTANHPHWKTRGYFDASDAYTLKLVDPVYLPHFDTTPSYTEAQ